MERSLMVATIRELQHATHTMLAEITAAKGRANREQMGKYQ